MDIDLGQYSSGYTSTPVFTLSGLTNCSVSMISGTKTARFTSSLKGLAKFNFTVTDDAGSTMTRTINVVVGDNQTALKNVNQLTMNVYPNPAVEKVCISGLSDLQNTKILSITNSTGQKVIEKIISSVIDDKIWFDVSGLKPGVYFVSVDKNLTAGRFIKL